MANASLESKVPNKQKSFVKKKKKKSQQKVKLQMQ